MYTTTITPASVPSGRERRRNEMRSPGRLSESELIDQCKHGDDAAWDLLVQRYQRTIYRFAHRLCRDYDEAGDVAAQAFVHIYANLHTFRGEGSFNSWLYRIVRNAFLDLHVRPAYRRRDTSMALPDNADGYWAELDIADSRPTPEEICLENEVASVIAQAVSELPANVRRPLKLRAKGASYAQIAEATGVNMGTVKSRINRGRTMLRERLPRLDELLAAN